MKVIKTALSKEACNEKNLRITLKNRTKKRLHKMLRHAQNIGNVSMAKRILAILSVGDGTRYAVIADTLKVSEESIRLWFKVFLFKGLEGLKSKKPSGRPSRLTKTQRKELDKIITEGPTNAGFPSACWRSPMIQMLIHERFGVQYSAYYISQLLKNMGFSFQKAKFGSDHKDPEKRKEWLEKTWPEILRISKEKNAYVLFGDEASFPQWGSLSYTWAKRGQQPIVKTSGQRKGYKVFGLIDYFSGRFFCKGYDKGRLNSESYAEFLTEVLLKTTKHIILIQDGARYHTSKAMREFFAIWADRVTVYNLPSYSPDYNPIEKLWKKIKEKEVHLHYFPTFESLKNKVEEALLHFKDLRNEVLSLFGFYWDKLEA